MANRGMTLNAAIKLTATQFNAGVKQVQRSLNSLKSTFLQVAGALGAGLGLSTLLTEVKKTAVQLSIAKATLENVAEDGSKYLKESEKTAKDASKATAEYAENLKFLKRISSAYGQDLLGLTQAFAKFRAAAGYAGVSLKEIQYIFEALTRAAGAYHLTAEQSANAMLAVEQMFSKGKVTSEELRRQLGNALPGAFGLMAKAAGMSTGEFEKAMKAGNILAKDVLPNFASELNKITEGANFDSLQSSLNRYSNAWTEFVEKTHFEDIFKGLVDGGAKALNFIGTNFRQLRTMLVELLAGIGGGKAFYNLQKKGKTAIQALTKEFKTLETKNSQIQSQVNRLTVDYLKMSEAGAKTQFDIKGLTAAEAKAAGLNQGLVNIIKNNEKMGKFLPQYSLRAADAMKVTTYRADELKKQISANNKELVALDNKIKRGSTAWGRAVNGLTSAWKSLQVAIRSALSAFVAGAIIAALAKIVQYLVDIWTYNSKLKKQAAEIDREVMTLNSSVSQQITKMRALGEQAADLTKTDKERKGYIDKINTALGLTGTKMLTLKSTANEINTAIAGWVEKLSKTSKMNAMYNKIGELETRNLEIADEIDYKRKNEKNGFNNAYIERQVDRLYKERDQNNRLIEKFKIAADKLASEIGPGAFDIDGGVVDDNGGGGGGGGLTGSLEKLKKAIDKYKESLKELQNRENNEAITRAEYYEEEGKLAEKTWKEIAGIDNLDENLKALGGDYAELAKWIKEVGTLYGGHKERQKQIEDEQKEVKELQKQYEDVKNKFMDIVSDEPKRENRNTFFDYKKSPKDKMDEEADIAEDYQHKLESLAEKLQDLKKDAGEAWSNNMEKFLNILLEKLRLVGDEAKSLREQANIAELAEDVKKLNKEVQQTRFEGISDVAQSFHSLSESVINLGKAIEELSGDEDSIFDDESYKKIKAIVSILDELTQMYNTVNSTVKMFSEAFEKKTALEKALAAQELALSQQKVASTQTEMLVEQESAANTSVMEGLKQVSLQQTGTEELKSAGKTVAAEGTKQAAVGTTTGMLFGEAVAGAASSQASIPYVGPILAAAAVAAIVALLTANMAKFAKGGIVGGNSFTGDKETARVNSGEMILNKAQQANLFNMINRGTVGGGQVEFVLRGDRLLGAINNYQSKRRG